jgi:hypothetical protein
MLYWGSFFTLLVGGVAGWWFGRIRARDAVNSEWMTALESAKLDTIIDEEQYSQIIRIQSARRKGTR